MYSCFYESKKIPRLFDVARGKKTEIGENVFCKAFAKIFLLTSKSWQGLSLDINISAKYVYVRKHAHTTRMKKPRKSCFANVKKTRVCECSVKYIILP